MGDGYVNSTNKIIQNGAINNLYGYSMSEYLHPGNFQDFKNFNSEWILKTKVI